MTMQRPTERRETDARRAGPVPWRPVAVAVLLAAALTAGGCGDSPNRRLEAVAGGSGAAAAGTTEAAEAGKAEGEMNSERGPIELSDDEWKQKLTPAQYDVCRLGGTERAFTGKYWDTKTPGTYVCAACGEPLFSSETKYDSGSGWPSFWAPIGERSVATEEDRSFHMTRTEVLCRCCGSHLGHVFDDGPPPTHSRFCINSAALRLVEAKADAGASTEDSPSGS